MLNKMTLQGRLVADPELATKGDHKYCQFRVAWSEKYKEKETKLFLHCAAWSYTAEFISKYFKKGQSILLEGRLSTQEWEKDGKKKSMIRMDVDKVHFCGDKKSNSDTGGDSLGEVAPLDDLPW